MLVNLNKEQIFEIVECMDIAYKEGFNMNLKLAIKLLNEAVSSGLNPKEARYAISKMNMYANDLESDESWAKKAEQYVHENPLCK